MKIFYSYWALFFVLLPLNAQTVGLIQHDSGSFDDGYVLFCPISSTTTYLIDKCGREMKTWPSIYRPGQSVYILPDGTLLRTGNANNAIFNAGGRGGIIQKIDWDGNATWTYTLSDATKCQHHDVKVLSNGNILIIAWEKKTPTEAIELGRNPSLIASSVWSEQILEIQPIGISGGNIVWEWHAWDHLIQDFDATKPNYGAIALNSQLINLNYNALSSTEDWLHFNSIDYNVALDQIMVSSHSFNEIWIIDHSTTTAQATSHANGNSGKGGDILYRWGNPHAYSNGSVASKKFFGQHNAQWIDSGLPYENQIMVFNNGNGRAGGNYSTVEIINPPVLGFDYITTLPYLPTTTSWIYNSGNPNNFYAQNISGSQQLSNGNVLICSGPSGIFFEVNSLGTTLWKYVNPVSNTILTQGTAPSSNLAFRSTFYSNNYVGFSGHSLIAGNTIENANTFSDACNLTLSVYDNELADKIKIYPNPTREFLTVDFVKYDHYIIQIINTLGQKVYENNLITRQIKIPVSNFKKGVYFIKINGRIYSSSNLIIN